MFEKFIVFICKSNFLMMLRLVQNNFELLLITPVIYFSIRTRFCSGMEGMWFWVIKIK